MSSRSLISFLWQLHMEQCNCGFRVSFYSANSVAEQLRLKGTFWRLTGPIPPAQAGLPIATCSGPHPDSFWIVSFQGGKLHTCSWEPVPVFSHPYNFLKCFLMFRRIFLCFSLCLLPLVLLLGTTEKSLGLSSFAFSLHGFIYINRIPTECPLL